MNRNLKTGDYGCEEPSCSSPLVLIVEDDEASRNLLKEALEKRGYETLEAADGFQGYKSAVEQSPDLVLLDVMMPDMDGFKVCEKLRENPETGSIPIIFTTALNDTSDVVRGFDAGGVDYITKPINILEAVARVDTHVRLRRLEKERIEYLKQRLKNAHWEAVSVISEGLAHNFNNIMAGLMGNLQFILGEIEGPEAREAAEDALESGHKAKRLVMMLQKYQELEPDPRPLEAASVIEEAVHAFQDGLDKKISIEIEDPAQKLPSGSRPYVKQVLEATLQNAVEAVENSSGTIKIVAKRACPEPGVGKVEVQVIDTGKGMDKDTQDKAFIPFFSTKKTVGVGLGLFAAKMAIEQVGGAITLHSNKGEGVTATVVLPEELQT